MRGSSSSAYWPAGPPCCASCWRPPRPAAGLHRLRLAGELPDPGVRPALHARGDARAARRMSGSRSPAKVCAAPRADRGVGGGLRLAVLSLADHPEPERFVAEFSGSERTIADYLLAEVLARQPDTVATAAAHVDPRAGQRSACRRARWSLRLGARPPTWRPRRVRRSARRRPDGGSATTTSSATCYARAQRTEPGRDRGAAPAAAGWCAQRGDVVEAVRHPQAAEDWRACCPPARRQLR